MEIFDFFRSTSRGENARCNERLISPLPFAIVCKWTNEISVFRSFKQEPVKRRFRVYAWRYRAMEESLIHWDIAD